MSLALHCLGPSVFCWDRLVPFSFSVAHCIFFSCPSVGGRSGCFLGCCTLALVNNSAASIGIHVSFQVSVFSSSGIFPGMGLLDHMVIFFIVFWGASIVFSIVAEPVYIPANSMRVPFSVHCRQHLLLINFLMIAILKKGASLLAQLVKNVPIILETWVWFLGREGPLEKGQATHSSILGLPWWLSW